MSKRILSLLLVFALCLVYVPAKAYAETATTITLTGITSKYEVGGSIDDMLTHLSVATSPTIETMYDGWGIEIDGTVKPYPTGLSWEEGHTYALYIPLAAGSDASYFDTANLTCTVYGDPAELSNVSDTFVAIRYPMYACTGMAQFSSDPAPIQGLVYNGSAQELITAGVTSEGTPEYKLEGGDWSTDIPTGTEPDVLYRISSRIAGDESHFDNGQFTDITVKIAKASATVKADDLTKTEGEADPELTAAVEGVFGADTLAYSLSREQGETAGTYTITPAGDEEQGNYTVSYETGTLTISEAPAEETPEETPEENPADTPEETPEENPADTPEENPPDTPEENPAENQEEQPGEAITDGTYDFTPPEEGIGSNESNANAWTWGERAQLPRDVANLYKVLVMNSVPDGYVVPPIPGGSYGHTFSHFLTTDGTWTLPDKNPSGADYPVDEVMVCEDHEPDYYANGDGKVDASTFGNSEFYIVKTGSGDSAIDYPHLTTGDVVSNKTFNGVYVTKLKKSGNAAFDSELDKLKSDAIASFRAFELDHPEVFWLNGSVKLRVLTVTISGEQTAYLFLTLADESGFSMRIADYAAPGAIEAAIKQRDAAVTAILGQIPAGITVRQKLANLNKWFTLHNEYNRSSDLNSIGFTPHRSLKALMGNYGVNGPVCDGYSRALKVICDKLGIPCILDTGTASNGSHSELHMWNRVQVDGVWYGVDCTWDDPIVAGKNGVVSGYENEKYLLVGNETVINGAKFGVSHPSNKTAGGTTGVLFAGLSVNPQAIDGYLVMPLTDVRLADWFYDHVKAAYGAGIVGGMTATTYGPSGQLTHAQIMVMVANLHSLQKGDHFKGSSVPGDHWAASFRNYCKSEGIIDNRFDSVLDKPVTRGEMAYYFANALTTSSYKNKKTVSLSDIGGSAYKAQIEKLAAADIVGGYTDGTFKPGNLVTRAEAAVFVSNIINAIGK